jgi:7-carboxy-7-deazaguanine synthase
MTREIAPITKGTVTLPLEHPRRVAMLAQLPPGLLLVHEIYRSIQGESTFAGLPCSFVRLTACHLRCRWCDTPHAFYEGHPMHRAQVVQEVCRLGCKLVEITGGEPLLQPEVLPLMSELADQGHTVLLETSGSLDVSLVDRRVHIIMDIKCPGSGEAAANRWENLNVLKPWYDEVKFVVLNRTDFDWSVEIVRRHALHERFPVLVSPVFGNQGPRLEPRVLAEWILETGMPLRLQLQLHKYIWSPTARGV